MNKVQNVTRVSDENRKLIRMYLLQLCCLLFHSVQQWWLPLLFTLSNALGYLSEGQGFKPEHCRAAPVGLLSKVLNPLCSRSSVSWLTLPSDPKFLTCWDKWKKTHAMYVIDKGLFVKLVTLLNVMLYTWTWPSFLGKHDCHGHFWVQSKNRAENLKSLSRTPFWMALYCNCVSSPQ